MRREFDAAQKKQHVIRRTPQLAEWSDANDTGHSLHNLVNLRTLDIRAFWGIDLFIFSDTRGIQVTFKA